VLSKRLSKLAKKEKLKQVKLTADDKEELSRLVTSQSSLKKKLDLKVAYRMPPGRWFRGLHFDQNEPEPLVALIHPKASHGHGSIVQRAQDGTVVGGVTLAAL